MTLLQTYYMLQLRTKKEKTSGNTIYAQEILVSLLKLFDEMHRCWRCAHLHPEGERLRASSLICASCKCAVYCSQECQINDWRQGKHKDCCENIGLERSLYKARKRRVEKALQEGLILTNLFKVDAFVEKCLLRPSEKLDYHLCRVDTIEKARLASMDAFYWNVASLACGGTHPIFGDNTISSQLKKKIRTRYEDVLSDFDHGSFTEENIIAMLNIAEILKYPTDAYGFICPDRGVLHCYELSVDQFITLYICYEPLNIHEQTFGNDFDRFRPETKLLQKLRVYNEDEENWFI